MRTDHRVRTYFQDQFHVAFMVGIAQRPAFIPDILMSVHAANPIGFAVEKKAIVRIHAIEPQAERLFNRIANGPIRCLQFRNGAVKVWGGTTVPKVRMFQPE